VTVARPGAGTHDERPAPDVPSASPTRSRLAATAGSALLDVIAILVFVGIGRSVHTDGVTVSGMASTAWPFLVGAAVGWLIGRGWRAPIAVVPTGLVVWLAGVALGMTLRVIAGQGTKVAFIAVALGFLGAELLGWRCVPRLIRRASGRRD